MRQVLMIITVFLMVGIPIISYAEHTTNQAGLHTWKEVNQTSDQILQLVKQEQFEDAKQMLDYFSVLFLEIDFKEAGITMTALRTVTTTFESAKEAVTAADLSLEERIYAVTTFRLAVDALSSEHHPLWLHTEENVMHAIRMMKESVNEEDNQQYQHRFNDFIRYYQMIRPALFIDLEPDHLQRIDSQIAYLENRRSTELDQKAISSHLEVIETEWTKLYERVKEDEADPSLWWVMFIIGGMITISLSYTGWRKYQAAKTKLRQKQ